MSVSILNRSGASGGLKPELTVTAQSGSTIDLLQGGVVVATYTLSETETQSAFVVDLGTYTVRATLGAQSKSAQVVIDVVGRYSVEIYFKLWLYKEGDECEDVTGGWMASSSPKYNDSNATAITPTLTKNADHMYVEVPYTSGAWNGGAVVHKTLVDVSQFDTAKIRFDVKTSHAQYRLIVQIGCLDAGATYIQDAFVRNGIEYAGTSWSSDRLVEIDVSSITGEKQIAIHFQENDYSMTGYVNIKEIWLE